MNSFFDNGFRFIDLFAGIGGFHQAMTRLGGTCVYASEINKETAETYKNNYNIEAYSDITKINPEDIPEFDVLCAGFPCQSFSKAGQRKGFHDARGVLFFDIVRILQYHNLMYSNPKYVILENVRNLVSHDKGNTWIRIRQELKNLGYNVIENPMIVSPHYLGIPQLRERAVIVAVKNDYFNKKIEISIPPRQKNTCSIDSVLVTKNTKEYKLQSFKITDYEERVLKLWDEFIKGISINRKIIGFPIWSDEFYKNTDTTKFPQWKKEFIQKNKELYEENKEFIDKWYAANNQLKDIKKTHRKFEWQVNGMINSVFDGIIQFRPSGVRVKQPTEFPALVAMVHIPIVGKYRRYLTPRETANLQSFSQDFKIDNNMRLAYKQFGNAVNVEVIYTVFKKFVDFVEENK